MPSTEEPAILVRDARKIYKTAVSVSCGQCQPEYHAPRHVHAVRSVSWATPKGEGGLRIPGVHGKKVIMPQNRSRWAQGMSSKAYNKAAVSSWGLLRQCAFAAQHVEPLPWQPGACLSSNVLKAIFSAVEMGLSSGAVHVSGGASRVR